jgi:two-component system OmpR family response regulator
MAAGRDDSRAGLGHRGAMRVLIVEDHLPLADLIRQTLQAHQVLADVASTGEQALWMAGGHHYDVITLDVSLPGIDGLETCRRLRAAGVETPILMLTARSAVDHRVAGLDAGADDYLTKPAHVQELLARLRALARRAPRPRPPTLRVGDLVYDEAACEVRRGGRAIPLTAKEREVLAALMRRPGKVVTRQRLIEDAWDGADVGRSNVVDVYVRYLRNKIDRPFGRATLETVRGVGYRLNGG